MSCTIWKVIDKCGNDTKRLLQLLFSTIKRVLDIGITSQVLRMTLFNLYTGLSYLWCRERGIHGCRRCVIR